jgi:hypothetical protein
MMRKLLFKITLYSLALAALLAVFGLYTRPEFMLRMANQVWACF